ncbi:MAG: class I SAM-dependent methyltransferase [Alphaproteobacteria bacterium]|jgi:2-polyprenyl-3-methyl-5-hydroxy-6-metoxy-1,4-benzoquinol methylase|nr:class I SAM-dependent methyltransferase [Alphaproteobacteria bacterium]
MEISEVHFDRIFADGAPEEVLAECANLYCKHYGKWSLESPIEEHRGKQIIRKSKHIPEYLFGNNAWIATARHKGRLVGYACVVHSARGSSQITWITQLVIHTGYQNKLVGSTLLNSIWGFSNHFAWGIASANPYAVRALEKATRRRCHSGAIKKDESAIREFVEKIPYLKGRDFSLTDSESVISSEFFQDFSSLPERLANACSKGDQWFLGGLDAGQEWIAATFNSQKQSEWSESDREKFMAMSGSIAREAYERMPQANHAWASKDKAEAEIKFILGKTGLQAGSKILDWGCGTGRHSAALGRSGFNVVGVDFSESAIRFAKDSVGDVEVRPEFIVGDCRRFTHTDVFDAAICLYDVIGSFPDEESNSRILINAIEHVLPGGWIVIGVMSYEYMESIGAPKFSSRAVFRALNELPASETMSTTGEIFDPKYVLFDKDRQIAYRKEIFDHDGEFPRQLIVRDRRYRLSEIIEICKKAALDVVAAGHIKAGNFALVDATQGGLTKEILVVARKKLS